MTPDIFFKSNHISVDIKICTFILYFLSPPDDQTVNHGIKTDSLTAYHGIREDDGKVNRLNTANENDNLHG